MCINCNKLPVKAVLPVILNAKAELPVINNEPDITPSPENGNPDPYSSD